MKLRSLAQRETGKGGIKASCKKFFEQAGIKVYNTSGRRQFGNTPGIADLFCCWEAQCMVFWFECKTPKGKQSQEQEQFQSDCWGCGVTVVVGGLQQAAEFVAKVRNQSTDPWPSGAPRAE